MVLAVNSAWEVMHFLDMTESAVGCASHIPLSGGRGGDIAVTTMMLQAPYKPWRTPAFRTKIAALISVLLTPLLLLPAWQLLSLSLFCWWCNIVLLWTSAMEVGMVGMKAIWAFDVCCVCWFFFHLLFVFVYHRNLYHYGVYAFSMHGWLNNTVYLTC